MSERRVILHVTVSGRVQGVGYRAWVEQQATANRLEGWVRNRHDGGVEAVFSGPPRAVAEMVALCRRGPSAARVEAVRDNVGDESHLALRHAGEAFSVLPTI